jgi:hypothetical protein
MSIRKPAFLSLLFIVLNGCTLFHFFNPAAQNEINYYASLKGWVQMGQTFSTDTYSGGEFSFACDSRGIPYLFFATASNLDTLFRYEGEWVVKNESTNFGTFTKAVLRFKQDIPFVAIQDSSSSLGVFDYFSDYPSLQNTYIAPIVDNFDFNISPSGKLVVVFETNNGTGYFVNVKSWNGSSWNTSAPFSENYTLNFIDNIYLEFYGESIYYFLCENYTAIYFDNGGPASSSVNYSPLLAKIAGDKVFYVYSTGDPNVYYHVENVSAGGYNTNISTLLRTNSYALTSHPTLTATKNAPYKAYCILADITGTNYSVAEISIDKTVKFLDGFPVSGYYNFGLYTSPGGALYLVAAHTFAGNESLQVFRYFE